MKRVLSLFLAAALSLCLCVPALAADFSDVPKSHTFYSAIMDSAARGIAGGYSDGTFQPAKTVSRSNFAVMLCRAFYADLLEYRALLEEGIDTIKIEYGILYYLDAFTGTVFDNAPALQDTAVMNEGISRYEMAQLMTNIMNAKGFAASDSEKTAAIFRITDYSSIPSVYRDAVANVYALGIITGYADGSFNGEGIMNRGQACVVINRLVQLLQNNGITLETPAQTPVETPVETPAQTPQAALLANGKPITDDNIREILYGLKAEYPEGRSWNDFENDYYSEVLDFIGSGCWAFGLICSDAVFGDLPVTEEHSDFDRVRVGDMLRVDHYTHTVVVLEKRANSVIVTEGNYNGKIHWGREISRQSLENGEFYATTRYPY